MPFADFTNVPGPSPWYMKKGTFATTSQSDYFWKHDESKDLSGITRLLNTNGNTILILDFQCYVQQLERGRILVWHDYAQEEKKQSNGRIHFIIVELDKLAQIQDYASFAFNMRKKKQSIGIQAEDSIISQITLSHLGEGSHDFSFPEPFHTIGEVLVLSDYADGRSNHFDKMYRAVYSIRFADACIEVFLQDWFNNGNLDFGYQWITQITRRKDGRLCGAGIRIDDFLLDESNRNLAK